MRWSIGLLGLLFVPAMASAHGLGAECKLGDKVVTVSAYFDDDTDAEGAKVRVLDAAKNTVAEGTTDAKGKWTFPRPPAGEYRVEIDAGAGHVARVRLTVPAEGATPPADAPKRAEFTRFRWRELGLGLGTITVAAVGVRWLMRKRDRGNDAIA